jgi:hypothetical protein
MCLTVVAPVAMATTPGTAPKMVDHACYVELSSGSVINLEHLCGTTTRRQAEPATPGIIDLRRGSRQLLTEMQQLQASLDAARTERERIALQRQFEDRLPYSDQVRQLQAQERNLRQQLRGTTNEAQRRTLSRQIDSVRQQIRQDPSHRAIRQARSQAFQELNR